MGAKSLEERAERVARPWFKKKRYLFPIGFFSFFFLIGVLTDPPADENYGYQGEDTEASGSISSPSSNENADAQTSPSEDSDDQTEGAEAPLPELEIVEGEMPGYIGYSATQVLETLEELDVSENDVRWPPLLDPRDEEFEEEASSWLVCEQDKPAGEEIRWTDDLRFGWGKDCDTYKNVPDFAGMDGSSAFDLALSRGLSVDGLEYDGETVCDQSIEPKTVLPPRSEDPGGTDIELAMYEDCAIYDRVQGEIEAEKERRAEAEAERAEQQRILNDPNTFEGGRRFINLHTEQFENDIRRMDALEDWLDAGAPIDGWLDAFFGDLPSMPSVHRDMWEEAPDGYQKEWDELREDIQASDRSYDEAYELFTDNVYASVELVPFVEEKRALTREALSFVTSLPYPAQ